VHGWGFPVMTLQRNVGADGCGFLRREVEAFGEEEARRHYLKEQQAKTELSRINREIISS